MAVKSNVIDSVCAVHGSDSYQWILKSTAHRVLVETLVNGVYESRVYCDSIGQGKSLLARIKRGILAANNRG